MRCRQCNVILTDEEACHKNRYGEYEDTCFSCLYGDASLDDEPFDDDEVDRVPD